MFLGVDGGGTKTAFCLVDVDGRIAAEARTDSVYYLGEGLGIVEPLLRKTIPALRCASPGMTGRAGEVRLALALSLALGACIGK